MKVAIIDNGVQLEYVSSDIRLKKLINVNSSIQSDNGLHGTAVLNTFIKYSKYYDEFQFDMYSISSELGRCRSVDVKKALELVLHDMPDVLLLCVSINNESVFLPGIEECLKNLSLNGVVIFGANTMEDELKYPASSEYTIGIKSGIFGPNSSFIYHNEETEYCEACCYPEWIKCNSKNLLFAGTSKALPCVAAQYVNKCFENNTNVTFGVFAKDYIDETTVIKNPYCEKLVKLSPIDRIVLEDLRRYMSFDTSRMSDYELANCEFSKLFAKCNVLSNVLPAVAKSIGINLDMCQLNYMDFHSVSNFLVLLSKLR